MQVRGIQGYFYKLQTACRRELFTNSSRFAKNYYEVLGVNKNSTQKEIRDAYVKLCKELHPDVQGSKNGKSDHKKFTELSHAYSVLSKPLDRQQYDEQLQAHQYQPYRSDMQRPSDRYEDPYLHKRGGYARNFRQQQQAYRQDPNYYRERKVYIVFGCLVLVFAGSLLHFFAYRYGTSKEMAEKMLRKSDKNWELYNQSKEDHKTFGTEGQIERILGEKARGEEVDDGFE